MSVKLHLRGIRMPITYGRSMSRLGVAWRFDRFRMMKSYSAHDEKSDVFVSYRHSDQDTAMELANYLDDKGNHVYIDIHDETLKPGDEKLEAALETAITNSATMLIVVSKDTQGSWWVPWEIGVSTAHRKPRALYKPQTTQQLPSYLTKLDSIGDPFMASIWIQGKKWSR